MYVVFSVKRVRVRKRFSLNDSQSSVILTRSRTNRLQEALCRLGLAAGGQAGAEIGSEQGLNGSRDTILRLVRRHQLPDPPTSRIVGIDDWAWKRRQRYGTLICDLESHQPLDLLADRSVETVSAWCRSASTCGDCQP